MTKFGKSIASCMLVGSFFAGSFSFAGAPVGGAIVFDPTNYGKNLLTAAQTAEQVSEQIRGNLTKLQQLQELARQGKAISQGDMQALAGIMGQGELGARIADMQGLMRAVSGVNGNLGDLKGRFDYIVQVSQRFGTTLEQYEGMQKQRREQGMAAAQAEHAENVRVLNAAQGSIKQVMDWQSRMPDSQTALMQMLNQQMALLNTNNAELLKTMTTSNMAAGNKAATTEAELEAARQDARNRAAAEAAALAASQKRMRDELATMKSSPGSVK